MFCRKRVRSDDARAMHQFIQNMHGEMLERAIAAYRGLGSWVPLLVGLEMVAANPPAGHLLGCAQPKYGSIVM